MLPWCNHKPADLPAVASESSETWFDRKRLRRALQPNSINDGREFLSRFRVERCKQIWAPSRFGSLTRTSAGRTDAGLGLKGVSPPPAAEAMVV